MLASAPLPAGRALMAALSICLIGSLASPGRTWGDSSPADPPPDSRRAVTLRGEIGAYGELYSINGRDPRRPSCTGRLFARPTLEFWNSVTLGFDFLLSTEGNEARQEINQLDLNPRWSWGYAHAGDFMEVYSPFTLSGITIRGAGLSIRPGVLRLAAVGGRTKRAVSKSDDGRSYRRELYGGRIGLAFESGSFLDLIALKSQDQVSSLADAYPDTSASADSTFDGENLNPSAVTPQENLILSLLGKIILAGGKLVWRNEAAACAYTHDSRASEIAGDDVPDYVKDVFNLRLSSSADYALRSRLDLRVRGVNLQARYRYVGPGYVSLGVPSITPDRQGISLRASLRRQPAALTLEASHQHNNLCGQSQYTTRRNRISGMLRLRPLRAWNSTFSVSYFGMQNAAESLSAVDYSSVTLRTAQVLALRSGAGLRTVSLDYTHQNAEDTNPVRQSAALRSHATGVRALIGVWRGLTVTPAALITVARSGEGDWRETHSYSLGGRSGGFRHRLLVDGRIGISIVDDSSSLYYRGRVTHRLTRRLSVTLEGKSTRFRADDGSEKFDEHTGGLRIVHRLD